jgi:hypothetical protein
MRVKATCHSQSDHRWTSRSPRRASGLRGFGGDEPSGQIALESWLDEFTRTMSTRPLSWKARILVPTSDEAHMSVKHSHPLALGLASCGLLMTGCADSQDPAVDLNAVGATASNDQDAGRTPGTSDEPKLVPPIAHDWSVVDAAGCAKLPKLTAVATLVRVGSADMHCLAATQLDAITVFMADTIDIRVGPPERQTPSGAQVFAIMPAASSVQVRVVRWDDGGPEYLLVRGAGSDGPSVDETVTGLR